MPAPLFSRDKWEAIVAEAVKDGPRVVAERYGLNADTVRWKVRQFGLSRRAVLADRRREVAECAAEHGRQAAAAQFGVGTRAVSRACREFGLVPAPHPLREVEHGEWLCYRRGCRCVECRGANRRRVYKVHGNLRERAAAGDPAVPHGTTGGYKNWGCRCDACRAAQSVANAKHRASRIARMEAGDPSVPHGTRSGYQSWECRCDACKAAYGIKGE